MHLLRFHFFHIGDQIATTSIPENYFHETHDKLVIANDRIWAFKHNPYVVVITPEEAQAYPPIDAVPDCRVKEQVQNYIKITNSLAACSQAEYMGVSLGLSRKNIKLRHPRLYIYEDEKIVPNKLVVHTTGSDRTRDNEIAIRTSSGEDDVRIMSDAVIETILKNYDEWQIVQVGSHDDKPVGGHCIDRRGQYDYWQTAKEISTAARFIGVNSGPMHIANCYPRVEKRIVLMEFPKTTLLEYKPGDVRNWLFSWLDPKNTFFTKFDYDVGLAYSFKNL